MTKKVIKKYKVVKSSRVIVFEKEPLEEKKENTPDTQSEKYVSYYELFKSLSS